MTDASSFSSSYYFGGSHVWNHSRGIAAAYAASVASRMIQEHHPPEQQPTLTSFPLHDHRAAPNLYIHNLEVLYSLAANVCALRLLYRESMGRVGFFFYTDPHSEQPSFSFEGHKDEAWVRTWIVKLTPTTCIETLARVVKNNLALHTQQPNLANVRGMEQIWLTQDTANCSIEYPVSWRMPLELVNWSLTSSTQ